MPGRTMLVQAGTIVAISLAIAAHAGQGHRPDINMHMQHQGAGESVVDKRILVHYPDELRIHTLSSMRDHLLTLRKIQENWARASSRRLVRLRSSAWA